MNKISLSSLLTSVIFVMGCLLFSCDQFNTLPDDFEDAMDLKINADLKLTFGTIVVLDAQNGQPIAKPVTVLFKKDIKDSAMIISIEGKQVDNALFTGGIFQFALNKGYNTPLDLPLAVYAEGYDTFYTVITFSKAQQQQFTFPLKKTGAGADGAPVCGLGIKDTVLGNIGADNKVAEDLSLSVTTTRPSEITEGASRSDLVTTISIPKGTILYNKKGEPLQGEIEAKSGYFDVSNQDAIAHLPGSLLSVAPGASPNEPVAFSAIAGIPVRVSGVPGSSGVEQTSFISAGLMSLDISVNGVGVDSFSQPLSVKMEMADSIINPQTGFPIRDGDTIDIWSISKNDSTWQWEGKAVISGPSVNGKLSSEFLIKHLSYWNLDWFTSAVCSYVTLQVTGVPSDINLYVEPAIVYPSGYVINYYRRQIMDVAGTTRTMLFRNVPKGYSLKFKFYTSEYGVVAFQNEIPVSDSCAAMVVECPSGIVSDQMRLTIVATDSSGGSIGPQYLYLYGSVPSLGQAYYVYSMTDTFNVTVPVSVASFFTIYSNGSPVGTYSVTGMDDAAIVGGTLKIPMDLPATCTFKAAIKGAIPGSYIYLNAILDSKGANPRTLNQYYYMATADTTLIFDKFLKDRYVKFSLYVVRGIQLPVVNNYEILMSSFLCGQSITIDLQNFYCRPKIVLHNTTASRVMHNVTVRAYIPALPGSPLPGTTPYVLFSRINTADTVFYPEALPAKWPVEVIVSGTQYDSCSLTSVTDVGRFEKQVLDTSYSNWNKAITVTVDDSKLNTPNMVSIPIYISIKCTNMEITPSTTFYYKLNCESQQWTTGYLSMGKTTLYLQKGRSYVFGIYDPKTGALKSGTMTITDDLIVRANASANGANLYDEVASPDVKEVLDNFCSRM